MADQKKGTKTTTQKAKQARYASSGRLYISATFNNTVVTVTDEAGKTLCWGSTGKAGFSGTRKSTPYAATTAIEQTLKHASEVHGVKSVAVYIRGIGPGRDSVLRVLRTNPVDVTKLVDMTPIPHDGIRPKKRRRV